MENFQQFKKYIENTLQTQMRTIWATIPYGTHLFDDQPSNEYYVTLHQMETLNQYDLLRELYIATNKKLIHHYPFDTKAWSQYLLSLQENENSLARHLKSQYPIKVSLFHASVQLAEYLHAIALSNGILPVITYTLLTEWQKQLCQHPIKNTVNYFDELVLLSYQLIKFHPEKNNLDHWIEKYGEVQKNYFQELYLNTILNGKFMHTQIYPIVSTMVH